MNTRIVVPLFLTLLVSYTAALSQDKQSEKSGNRYVCLPCGRDCDEKVYDNAGTCPHCGMKRVKKSTVMFGSIKPEQLCGYISRNTDVVLLDVRTREEFEGRSHPDYGTLKNAINIPIQELDSRLGELSAYKDKEVIVHCSHGQRSSQASYVLMQNGFENVRNMTGGLRVMKDDACKMWKRKM